MSQVKNLRAMFENNKGDSSPTDRGRSPIGTPNTADQARPLSKVRTNFVAVEKNGRIGLQRDQSGESSISRRRMSTETDMESIAHSQRTNMASPEDTMGSSHTPFGGEIAPGSGALSDEPSTNPDKSVDEEQSSTSLQPATSATIARASIDESSLPNKKTAAAPKNSAVSASVAPSKASPARKLAPESSKQPATKRPTTKTAPTAATTTRPTPSTKVKQSQPVKSGVASETGFVKPRPKSPTKPINLPSSLMAPTASSVSKGGAARQSLSRQSGGVATSGTLPQSASAHNIGSSTTTKHVRRQSAVVNRARPSFGPPPTKAVRQEPTTSKRQSQVDDSFLSRMMRPTQSSSSKTADKADKSAPVTPPKKPAATDSGLRRERESQPKKTGPTRTKAATDGHASATKSSELASPRGNLISKMEAASSSSDPKRKAEVNLASTVESGAELNDDAAPSNIHPIESIGDDDLAGKIQDLRVQEPEQTEEETQSTQEEQDRGTKFDGEIHNPPAAASDSQIPDEVPDAEPSFENEPQPESPVETEELDEVELAPEHEDQSPHLEDVAEDESQLSTAEESPEVAAVADASQPSTAAEEEDQAVDELREPNLSANDIIEVGIKDHDNSEDATVSTVEAVDEPEISYSSTSPINLDTGDHKSETDTETKDTQEANKSSD